MNYNPSRKFYLRSEIFLLLSMRQFWATSLHLNIWYTITRIRNVNREHKTDHKYWINLFVTALYSTSTAHSYFLLYWCVARWLVVIRSCWRTLWSSGFRIWCGYQCSQLNLSAAVIKWSKNYQLYRYYDNMTLNVHRTGNISLRNQAPQHSILHMELANAWFF